MQQFHVRYGEPVALYLPHKRIRFEGRVGILEDSPGVELTYAGAGEHKAVVLRVIGQCDRISIQYVLLELPGLLAAAVEVLRIERVAPLGQGSAGEYQCQHSHECDDVQLLLITASYVVLFARSRILSRDASVQTAATVQHTTAGRGCRAPSGLSWGKHVLGEYEEGGRCAG